MAKTNKNKWIVEKWPISKIKPLDDNPRTVKKDKFKKLKSSIERNGNYSVITVDNDGVVLSGNQRLKVHEQNGEKEVFVAVPQFKLSKKQRQDIIVSGNITVGDFDTDILANQYDEAILMDWGIWDPEKDMKDIVPANEFVNPKEVVCPHCGETITLAS